jgi:RimJ/RimL family protein N-acetyltransferase
MHIQVSDDISLSALGEKDVPALVECLKDREIYDGTLRIPYPYTKEHALSFLDLVAERSQRFGRLMDWAIRRNEEELIGMIGFQGSDHFAYGSDEIGFWLAKPYWGRGIMTATIQAFVCLAFDTYRMTRLEARIFSFNKVSMRVVQKAGFRKIKTLPREYLKEGFPIDAELYAIAKNT